MTSNSLSVAFVTGGSTGPRLRVDDDLRDCEMEREVGAEDAEDVVEGLGALCGIVEVAGDVARGAESHLRGDSCEGCGCVDVFCSSWTGCCIWTSVSCMGSPSALGQGADVERFLRDRSTGPPVPCSWSILSVVFECGERV